MPTNQTKIQTSRAASNRLMGAGAYGMSTQAGGPSPKGLPMPQGISLNTTTGFGQAQMIAGNTMMNLGNTIGKIGIAIKQQNEANEKATIIAQGRTLEQLTQQLSTIKDKTARATFIKEIWEPAYKNFGQGVNDDLVPIVNAMKQSLVSQRSVVETVFLQAETVGKQNSIYNKSLGDIPKSGNLSELIRNFQASESQLSDIEASPIQSPERQTKARKDFVDMKKSSLESLGKTILNRYHSEMSVGQWGTLFKKFKDKGHLYDPSDTNLTPEQKIELGIFEGILDKNLGPGEIEDLFIDAQNQKLDILKKQNNWHDEQEKVLFRNTPAVIKNTYENYAFQTLDGISGIENQLRMRMQLQQEARSDANNFSWKKKSLDDIWNQITTISRDQKDNLELLMQGMGTKVDIDTGRTWKDLLMFGSADNLTPEQKAEETKLVIGRLREAFPEINKAMYTNLYIESTFRKVYGAESKTYQRQKNLLNIEERKIKGLSEGMVIGGDQYAAKANNELDTEVRPYVGTDEFPKAMVDYKKRKASGGDTPPPQQKKHPVNRVAMVRDPVTGAITPVNLEDANPDNVVAGLTGLPNHLNMRVQSDAEGGNVAAEHVRLLTHKDPSSLFTEGTKEARQERVAKYITDNKISPTSSKAREIYKYIKKIENEFLPKLKSAYSDATNPYKQKAEEIAAKIKEQQESLKKGIEKQKEQLPKDFERQKEKLKEQFEPIPEIFQKGLSEGWEFFRNLISPNPAEGANDSAGNPFVLEPIVVTGEANQDTAPDTAPYTAHIAGSKTDVRSGSQMGLFDPKGADVADKEIMSRDEPTPMAPDPRTFRSETGGTTISDFDKDGNKFVLEPIEITPVGTAPGTAPGVHTKNSLSKNNPNLNARQISGDIDDSLGQKLNLGEKHGTHEIIPNDWEQIEPAMEDKKITEEKFKKLFDKERGNLTETDRLILDAGIELIYYEGNVPKPYRDIKNIITFGIGFTGEEMFLGNKSIVQKFKEILPKYIERAKAIAVPPYSAKTGGIDLGEWHRMTPNMKVALVVAAYRGDITPKHRTGKLISKGKYKEAATEFLDNWDISTRFGVKNKKTQEVYTEQEWNATKGKAKDNLVKEIKKKIENDGPNSKRGTLKHRLHYIYKSIKDEEIRQI
jgi:uncharacterized protein YlbG (UPF0298 family)